MNARPTIPNPCQPDAAEHRLDALDKQHAASGFYRQFDANAKRRAKLAFVAHCAAVADGDADLIAATRERFMQASAELAKARDAR